MYYSGINYESIVDGEGIRIVIYFSGCTHHCNGCQNKSTWNFTNGSEFNGKVLQTIKEHLNNKYISGITVSGGDLLCSSDAQVDRILLTLKSMLKPKQTLWVYTGYTFKEIRKKPYLKYIDVLVDGMFEEDKFDEQLPYRGSLNQRIIDVAASLKKKKPVDYKLQ